jgi:hypothetical protein
VKQRFLARSFCAAVSLLAISAWLLAANHCVVAALLPNTMPPPSEREHCPGHKAPADDQNGDDCDGTGCCKALASPLALGKMIVGYDLSSFVTCEYLSDAFGALCREHPAGILTLETGPPGASSFVETVLQRSILAHAPPLFA